MNIARILNRAAAVSLSPSFEIPKNGKFHLARQGEFPGQVVTDDDEEFNVIQVIDEQAITAMVNRFAKDKAAGASDLLVDRDHLSSDPENETIAEGWIQNIEGRSDLYADIRLSAQGEADIKGGNYRFISGVWDVSPIGQDKFTEGCRVRPFLLTEAGLTNRPNISGLAAIANRRNLLANAAALEVARTTTNRTIDQARAVANRARQLIDGPRSAQAFARAWRAARDEFPPLENDSL
jgi:phage I-like protein